MKRCPECRRDYADDTLLYCLEDGVALVQGSVPSPGEAPTAIISDPGAGLAGFGASESPTRVQAYTTGPGTERTTADKPITSRGIIPKLIIAGGVVVILSVAGLLGYRYLAAASIGSIAVLPFANATGDKEIDFLAEGIAETLINNFTKIPELKVTARSTAFRFRGREAEPLVVGRELNVDSMLTGRLMQRGDQLNIQVDLIDTSDGAQIWGNRYEGKSSELVTIQQRIATDVSLQLKLKLTGSQQQQVSKTYTQDPEAFRHYLRGRYYWNRRTADGMRTAIDEFTRAIAIDPAYALAYVGLADCYILLEEYAGGQTRESLALARSYVQKAFEIDADLGEGHAALAMANHYSWRWADAEIAFKRAIELGPNYPTGHQWYHGHLRDMGKVDEALAEIKRAQELDPLSGIVGVNVGMTSAVKGDLTEAANHLERVIELEPNSWVGHSWLGFVRVLAGQHEEGLHSLMKGVELNRANRAIGMLAYGLAVTGKRAEAMELVKELEERYSRREVNAFQVAAVWAGLSDREKTFEWLEKSFNEANGELPRIRWYWQFDTVRDDPRYKDIVGRMGFPE